MGQTHLRSYQYENLKSIYSARLQIQYKFGTRNLFENSFRLAKKYLNKRKTCLHIKLMSLYACNRLEANNMNAVDGTTMDNPGG